jgi:hypothetical protein
MDASTDLVVPGHGADAGNRLLLLVSVPPCRHGRGRYIEMTVAIRLDDTSMT